MAAIRWRVYYGDGSIYDDDNGEAWDAPTRNVQFVLTSSPEHNWDLCRFYDYYWYLPELDRWSGGDIFGLFDYLIEPGQKKVLFGRTITNAEFQKVFDRACADQSAPMKTGWQLRERKNAGLEPNL
jgi:hypothetical protein